MGRHFWFALVILDQGHMLRVVLGWGSPSVGMTQVEIEAVLGGPGLDLGDWGGRDSLWFGTGATVCVRFGGQPRRAVHVEILPSRRMLTPPER
ncbi:MAG: hypothetical protein L0Z62_34625 [Gemmataceae bacterium]|nr:hypothetical protein [Gemmataceae bacterium]